VIKAEFPWSMKVAIDNIPQTGAHFNLSADERIRTELAGIAGLRALPRLQASFEVSRYGPDGLHVVGEVSATIGQTCVVTLEPMESELRERVDLLFAPPAVSSTAGESEVTMRLDEREPPDTLSDGAADLGAVATEFLLLGIDPYPRKPGATFEFASAGDPESHPFAALSALKMGKGGK
jgi:uncharacterized protein DUF177 involved in 23S rRNA accumulation